MITCSSCIDHLYPVPASALSSSRLTDHAPQSRGQTSRSALTQPGTRCPVQVRTQTPASAAHPCGNSCPKRFRCARKLKRPSLSIARLDLCLPVCALASMHDLPNVALEDLLLPCFDVAALEHKLDALYFARLTGAVATDLRSSPLPCWVPLRTTFDRKLDAKIGDFRHVRRDRFVVPATLLAINSRTRLSCSRLLMLRGPPLRGNRAAPGRPAHRSQGRAATRRSRRHPFPASTSGQHRRATYHGIGTRPAVYASQRISRMPTIQPTTHLSDA